MQAGGRDGCEIRGVQGEEEGEAEVVAEQAKVKDSKKDHNSEGNDQQPVPSGQHRADLKEHARTPN